MAVSVPLTASERIDASESREEIQASITNTMAVVDRWFDSGDYVPWSPPTAEHKVRLQADPQSVRPEIARKEERLHTTIAQALDSRNLDIFARKVCWNLLPASTRPVFRPAGLAVAARYMLSPSR